MNRLESAREGRLRAACDRCHDLKNRCVRTGGGDSRCDRCERLDIDCVYRNTSRIGRPRTQRRASIVSSQPQHTGREGSYQDDESREANSHRRAPRKRSFDASAAGTDQRETEVSRNTTLVDSPSDVMSLLAPAEVAQQPDMDWSLDFSNHLSCLPEPLYHDPPLLRPLPGASSTDASSFPSDSSGGSAATTEQTTDRLLQLQGQLHRLLWATEREREGEPAAGLVEESLEVIKTFLEILQAALAAQGRLPPETTMAAVWTASKSVEKETDFAASSAAPKQQTAAPITNYITAQQALTCYSYMLLMLDRVIGALTSSDYGSATPWRADGEASSPPPAALSLGFFNLASQPALNAEVVLHLLLRMVQRLRVLIQVMVSGCKELTADQRSSTSSSGSTMVEGLSSPRGSSAATSIAVTSHAVAELVSERERSLIERLLCLTGGP
ncbi:hypothetical protein QBC46DRAFT_321086 [Diplogelasinospora grovesii]|uniref:Zn(2)-C6 fungal-type domain-containing protein n=1 Tax=Diplogelasinospora grovesii TaxID=303347 RepID=A0AAN6S1L6_9PEZI|nr:hypothetical protein QBC46DRAFT_321086 [Diplogelasinospora grovesii]